MKAAAPTGPTKPNKKPAIPMKQLHWGVIQPTDLPASSLWKSLDDTKVVFDLNDVHSKFAAPVTKKKGPAGGGDDKHGASSSSSSTPSPSPAAPLLSKKKEAISILDSKRAYAVNIALARFRMTHPAIRDALLSLDDKILDEEKMNSLYTIVPTADEIEAVNEYSGDADELGQTEKFFLTIGTIPNVRERVEIFLFRLRYENQYSEIVRSISLLEQALSCLRSCKSLHRVLEFILALGNYLNGGTNKGGAFAFHLDTLTKLKNMKAADNQMTLLHFLVTQLTSNAALSQYASFMNECGVVMDASKLELTQLSSDINRMNSMVDKLKKQLSTLPRSSRDRFHAVLTEFSELSGVQCQSLITRIQSIEKDSKDLITWFGEDGSQMKIEELFTIFTQFVTEVKTIVDEMDKKRVEQEREARIAAEKEKRDREREEKKIRAGISGASSNMNNSDSNNDTNKAAKAGRVVDEVMGKLTSTNNDDLLRAIKQRRKIGTLDRGASKGLNDKSPRGGNKATSSLGDVAE